MIDTDTNTDKPHPASELIAEDEAFRQQVVEIVVADIKARGPIALALLGIYPDTERPTRQ